MKLFSTLNLDRLRGGSEPPVKIDPALNQVYLALHQVQRNRQFIEVTFDGDDVIYQSMIIDLDPQARTVLIDELFPRGFEGLAGQCVTVCVRQKLGRKLRFQTVIVEALRDERAPLYSLAMPASLEGDQRRSAYRLPLTRQHDIEPEFVGPDNDTHKARLNNLSVSGVGLELEGDFSDELKVGDELNQLFFGFAGIDVNCDLTVKNVQAIEGETTSTIVGGEFVGLPAREQRLLAKCIANLQRQRIQQIEGVIEGG